MPLRKGKSHIGDNIKELEEHGSRPRSHKQILAIALNEAGEYSKKSKKPGSKLKAMGSSVGYRPNPTNPKPGSFSRPPRRRAAAALD